MIMLEGGREGGREGGVREATGHGVRPCPCCRSHRNQSDGHHKASYPSLPPSFPPSLPPSDLDTGLLKVQTKICVRVMRMEEAVESWMLMAAHMKAAPFRRREGERE
jgi:hypothetical protein